MTRSNVLRFTLFAFCTLCAYASLLYYQDMVMHNDWRYSNGFSLVLRSIILYYQRFPTQDPWVCGGVDLLANPQIRLFSPTVIIDLLFAPKLANLYSLVIYGFAGAIGMFQLLRQIKLSETSAIVGTFLFLNSSYFGLHFAEGQITHGSMQLFPWVALCCLNIKRQKYQILLTSLFTLFLLDGAIYTFTFALLLILSWFSFGVEKCHWKHLVQAIYEKPFWWAFLVLIFLLITSVKTIPSMLSFGSRTPVWDNSIVPPSTMWHILFNPLGHIRLPIPSKLKYQFHEFGCYIGIISALVVLLYLCRRRFKSGTAPLVVGGFLFFWMSSGWGMPFNPWVLFQKVPFFNNAHVPSRLFILFFIYFLILLVKALDELKQKNRFLFLCLASLLCLEYALARNYPMIHLPKTTQKRLSASDLITSQTIQQTAQNAQKPYHYLKKDTGSAGCYDVAATQKNAIANADPNYRGEVYFLEGTGMVRLQKYLPGLIQLEYQSSGPVRIQLNTNQLQGWNMVKGEGQLIPSPSGRLTLQSASTSQQIQLEYWPKYANAVLVCYLIGLALFLTTLLLPARIKK